MTCQRFLSVMFLWVCLFTGGLKAAPPNLLTNLSLTELVALLNENTHLNVNLELDKSICNPGINIDRTLFDSFQPSNLVALLKAILPK